jgi:hypothetical protein
MSMRWACCSTPRRYYPTTRVVGEGSDTLAESREEACFGVQETLLVFSLLVKFQKPFLTSARGWEVAYCNGECVDFFLEQLCLLLARGE